MKSSEMYLPAPAAVIAASQTSLLNEAEIEQLYGQEEVELSEDEWLVQGCIQGNQQAWEELIDKYKRLIYSIPLKYGASSADAADVFQAVCIEVLNSLPQIKNVQSLRSWLITVTIRQAYRWKRKQTN